MKQKNPRHTPTRNLTRLTDHIYHRNHTQLINFRFTACVTKCLYWLCKLSQRQGEKHVLILSVVGFHVNYSIKQVGLHVDDLIGIFQLHLVSCSHCFCVHLMHECRSNNHKEKKLNEGGNGSHEINLAIKSQSATSSMNKYKQYVLWGYEECTHCELSSLFPQFTV